MNREIKFRAWDKMGNCWINEFAITKEGAILLHNTENYYETDAVGPILMQFTGLTDKHGKEIYEGDILKYTHDDYTDIDIVEWDGGRYPDPFDVTGDSDLSVGLRLVEVIGNIHEHPNLLEDKV